MAGKPPPFEDVSSIKNAGFPIAMLDYQRVIAACSETLVHAPFFLSFACCTKFMYSMLYMSDIDVFCLSSSRIQPKVKVNGGSALSLKLMFANQFSR